MCQGMKLKIKRLLTASFLAPGIVTACIIVVLLVVGRGRPEVHMQPVSPILYLPLVSKNHPHKRGVAVCHPRCDVVHAVGAIYLRQWGTQPIQCSGVESVPCVWGKNTADRVLSGQVQIGGNGSTVLSANEPDRIDQSWATPQEWVPYQHALVHQFPQYRWASPATVDVPGWLDEFVDLYVDEYGEFPFSVLDFHCYEDNAQDCIEHAQWYVDKFHEWNLEHGGVIDEIWLSEFALADVQDATVFLDWLDAQPEITRYFWFCTECIPGWYCPDQYLLADYKSDPVKLRPLGIMYKNR